MNNLQEEVDQLVKDRKGGPVKLCNTPAEAKSMLLKNQGETVNHQLY